MKFYLCLEPKDIFFHTLNFKIVNMPKNTIYTLAKYLIYRFTRKSGHTNVFQLQNHFITIFLEQEYLSRINKILFFCKNLFSSFSRISFELIF